MFIDKGVGHFDLLDLFGGNYLRFYAKIMSQLPSYGGDVFQSLDGKYQISFVYRL